MLLLLLMVVLAVVEAVDFLRAWLEEGKEGTEKRAAGSSISCCAIAAPVQAKYSMGKKG